MRLKIKDITKRALIIAMCIISLISATVSVIPLAYSSGSQSLLSSNRALGSPVLNNNFTLDNWNKWEIICWGVFLSNFCQPLIDDYESAFKETGDTKTSNGAGYRALVFGSGNDRTNNETIEALCDYAIEQQKGAAKKTIYVSWVKVEDGVIGEKPDLNAIGDDATLTPAKVKDFFLKDSKDGGSEGDNSSYFHIPGNGYVLTSSTIANYGEMYYKFDGNLPLFYVQSSSGQYTKIFDFTDSWDIQVFCAMLNGIRANATENGLGNEFESALKTYQTSEDPVGLDVFGNILIGSTCKMLVPAACNQHITNEPKINLLNSWIFNGYSSTYSDSQLILGLKQGTVGWEAFNDQFGDSCSGVPALSVSNIGNAGFLYYDTDSIVASNGYKVGSYGKLLKDLFDCDINNNVNKYPIKFEIAGSNLKGVKFDKDILATNLLAANLVANTSGNTTQPKMLTELIQYNGDRLSLFSNSPVAIPVKIKITKTREEPTSAGAIRHLMNALYKVYSGNTNQSSKLDFNSADVKALLESSDANSASTLIGSPITSTFWDAYKTGINDGKYSKQGLSKWLGGANDNLTNHSSRVVLLYPVSETMKAVSQVLGVNENIEQSAFAQYSTMMYLTYLDWYGIVNKTTLTGGTDASSEFNLAIYDETSDILKFDPSSKIDTKSAEEMQAEVTQLGYYMLHPEEGREYRKNLIVTGVADWIYEQYNRICYGGASSDYSGSASKSQSGFLAVETYDENVLTSPFLDNYADIAVIIIMGSTILIILFAIIKGKRFTWILLSLVVVVTTVLLQPTSGEITPYMTSLTVQKLFQPKMSFWAVSEGIANTSMEAELMAETSGLDDEAAKQSLYLIKNLSALYTDRALMLKQDISQKVLQHVDGVYTEAQSLQSARWLLPMLMQQFTGVEEDATNYLYVKLSNVLDDCSNMYWYFNPDDAKNVTKQTLTSTQDPEAVGNTMGNANKAAVMTDADTTVNTHDVSKKVDTDINYRQFSYTVKDSSLELPTHTYAYLLDVGRSTYNRKTVFGANAENYENVDSWQKYIDMAVDSKSATIANWRTDNPDGFEYTADTYERSDRNTITSDMNYLLSTESPIYYFYNGIKDSFDTLASVGLVIGSLQGDYETVDGVDKRINFMYATESDTRELQDFSNAKATGWVRDVLDLEEMFTNMIPYMYEMQLIAGGFDGESGILVESVSNDSDETQPLLISKELSYYEGQPQSWMYRCNWATKLMENPNYSKATTVRDSNGNKHTVTNPMLAEAYPEDRPMVFSEAQMHAMGLSEADLNLVELKCVEVNKNVTKQWTLLINYAGTSGLTKEVLYRQMATDALLIFNEEFSNAGLTNSIYKLYPTTIDLRYLSFDAIMKMLMINVSRDTSYVYGNTMETLINNSDTIQAFLLLMVAWICTVLMPLFRTILMAAIFYLGFLANIRSLFSSNKYKVKIACGQLVTNVLFMVYTIAYYGILFAMMSLSSTDEVLSYSRISVNVGNPGWLLLVLMVLSGVYVVLMGLQIVFCFKHYRDMGAEMYSSVASSIVGKLSDSISGLGGSITNFFDSESSSSKTVMSNSSGSVKGTGIKSEKQTTTTTTTTTSTTNSTTTLQQKADQSEEVRDELTATPYETVDNSDEINTTSAADIDAQIKAGSEM